MITLITGAPGSGKTLYCIDKVIQPLVGTVVSGSGENGQPANFAREIYTNINGLKLPHVLVDAPWLSDLAVNKRTAAVVVFDEVQRVWPNRPTGSKKPAAVEYLETHRHDGIDVVLLTQNPQLLDPAVRALVGRHLHMRRVGGIGAAVVYEWDACSNGLNFKSAFTKRGYRYSRKVFDLYESAKLHTKPKRSLPGAVWGILIGLAGFAYFGPKFYTSLEARAKGPVSAPTAPASSPGLAGALPGGDASRLSRPGGFGGKELTPVEYRASYQPRMSSLPHTASRYDSVTAPTRAPVPAACIQSRKRGCLCWSQDATRLNVSEYQCRAIVDSGYFLDFAPDRESGRGLRETVSSGSRPVPASLANEPAPLVARAGLTGTVPLSQVDAVYRAPGGRIDPIPWRQ